MDKKQKEVIVYSKQIMNLMEELVGGANHEINNLLFVTQMAAEVLETTDSVKDKQNAVKQIETQTQRISDILRDLRSVIKDCSTEEVKVTQVSSVSEHVIELCKTRFNNHKVIFKNNVPNDIFIQARESQMAQALLAILNSCHDAVVQKKSLSRWINFDVSLQDGTLKIQISDSGDKVSKEDAKNVFSPSFDAKGRKGLPLVIAKNIVESHGGDLSFKEDADFNTFEITMKHYSKAQSKVIELEDTPYLRIV